MTLDEIKNLKIVIKIPEFSQTLEEMGYTDGYIKENFLYDPKLTKQEIRELIIEDIDEYLYEFVVPEINIYDNTSN